MCLGRTLTSSNSSARVGHGVLSEWIEKREKKLSDKICLFGYTFNYGTDDPMVISLIAIVLRATW